MLMVKGLGWFRVKRLWHAPRKGYEHAEDVHVGGLAGPML